MLEDGPLRAVDKSCLNAGTIMEPAPPRHLKASGGPLPRPMRSSASHPPNATKPPGAGGGFVTLRQSAVGHPAARASSWGAPAVVPGVCCRSRRT